MGVVVGLNFLHADSAASLVVDGRLIAAAEEERFTRIKHDSSFPNYSLAYCLSEAGIDISDVDIVAVNGDSRSNVAVKVENSLGSFNNLQRAAKKIFSNSNARPGSYFGGEPTLKQFLGSRFTGNIKYFEHHLCHQASALYCCGERNSLGISIDGFGDFVSGTVAQFSPDLEIKWKQFFPHSLGIFYQAICQFIGFPNYGDEYKVMGLAAYGRESKYCTLMADLLDIHDLSYSLNLEFFRHHTADFSYRISEGIPIIEPLYSDSLADLLGVAPRTTSQPLDTVHRDIAYAAQRHFENIALEFISHAKEKFAPGAEHISMSGGCAMNSVANGRILETGLAKRMFVQPAGGDSGGALGASLLGASSLGDIHDGSVAFCPFLGPEYSSTQIKEAITEKLGDCAEFKLTEFSSVEDLIDYVVPRLADGSIMGWFRGRSEWGPRALGNRSIIASASKEGIKDLINSKIKRRESFRPFAPMVPLEDANKFFKHIDSTPYMTHVFAVHDQVKPLLPSVTHADGSARVQTVETGKASEEVYKLLKAFGKYNGIPVLINTSFNENEPVVNRPEEAIDCFLRTSMDLVVLENIVIERPNSASE
jgi:carbamoyltransferase